MIQDREGIPAHLQTLFLPQKQLRGGSTLVDNYINQGTFIYLVQVTLHQMSHLASKFYKDHKSGSTVVGVPPPLTTSRLLLPQHHPEPPRPRHHHISLFHEYLVALYLFYRLIMNLDGCYQRTFSDDRNDDGGNDEDDGSDDQDFYK
ncbi:ubiquitin subgroup protein [Tanacetum coccineum]